MPSRHTLRGVAIHAAVAVGAAALPVGLVAAAAHVSRSEIALPAQLLELVAPPLSQGARHERVATLPRHATAWPTRSRPSTASRRAAARSLGIRQAVVAPALVNSAGVAAPLAPHVSVESAAQPRPAESAPAPEVMTRGPLPYATAPELPSSGVAAAPPAPVAEVATAAPPAAVVEPAPVAPTPPAPSAPATAKPHHHEQEEGGGD